MKQFSETNLGMLYASGAFLLWGFSPLYFKYLDFVPVDEILAHRVIWSVVVTALLITLTGAWHKVSNILREPKKLAILAVSSVLLSFNLIIFILAINY